MESTTTLLTEIGTLTVKVTRTTKVTSKAAKPIKYTLPGGEEGFEADMAGVIPPQETRRADFTVLLSGPKGSFQLTLSEAEYRELLTTMALLQQQQGWLVP